MTARRTYEITISGRLGELASAFAPHAVHSRQGLSIIRVEHVDQATLFGVLAQVQALGLDLREVRIAG